MSDYTKIKANKIGVLPATIKGQEDHGVIYLTWSDSLGIGAQCSICNTIVWTNGRTHPILAAEKPQNIPASGDDYKAFHASKISSFLASLPKCPTCQNKSFDKFINNTCIPRFSDGEELDPSLEIELNYLNADNIEVFWLQTEK